MIRPNTKNLPKIIDATNIVCFAWLKKLIDLQPKLQMIKFLLRLHLAWLQPKAYIVNNIAICETKTVGE